MLNKDAHILKIFSSFKLGDWVICLHCGRAYQVGEYRIIGELQFCPFDGCSGDAVLDPWHWPGPGVPVRGERYNLDGTKQD